MGGKSGGGSTIVGYRYYMAIHQGLCRGPIDALVEVKVGDRKALTGSFTTTQFVDINQPMLFGGDDKEGGIKGSLKILMGEPDQVVDSIIKANMTPPVSDWRGVASLFYYGQIGSNNPYPKPWSFLLRRQFKGWMNDDPWYPAKLAITLASNVNPELDRNIFCMNPAHIIYESATNKVWGRGLPASQLNEASFTAAADTLFDEQFGMCLRWNRRDDLDKFIQTVLNHIAGVVYIDRLTGLLTLDLIRNDYNPNTIPFYTYDSGLLEIVEDQLSSNDTVFNEIIVSYRDPIENKDAEVRVQNVASIQSLGGAIVSTSVSYPGIPTGELALRVGQRDLAVQSSNLRKLKVKLNRRGWIVKPGGVFKISVPTRGITNLILRAAQIEESSIDDGTITITAVQDVFNLPLTSFNTVQPSAWLPPDFSAHVVETRRIEEITYYDLANNILPADLDSAITNNTDGAIKIFAERPTGLSVDYIAHTAATGETPADRTVNGWDANAELVGAIGHYDTSISFDAQIDTQQLADAAVGYPALIDDEFVRVDAIDFDAGTATIARGVMDTIPTPHADGTQIWFQFFLPSTDGRDYATSDSVDVKLLTRTNSDKLDPADAPTDAIVIAGRQGRPYPPGDLEINAVPFGNVNADLSSDLVFTWAHRDRLTQGNFLLEHGAASTGPEVGTTYTLRVYDSDGVTLLRTEAAIATAGFTYTAAMHVADGEPLSEWFELESVRDGLVSWQKYRFQVSRAPIFTIAGSSTVEFESLVMSNFSISGTSGLLAVSVPIVGSIFTIAGSSTAEFEADVEEPSFSISGSATAVFVNTTPSMFTIAGSSTAEFFDAAFPQSEFSISGTATATFIDATSSTFTIAGSSTAEFVNPMDTDTWNPADKSADVTLSNGDYTATVTTTAYSGVRSVDSKSSGKYHVEFEIVANGSVAHFSVGVANASAALNNYGGSEAHSIGYYGDGSVWRNGSSQGTIGSYTVGDIVEMEVDLDNDLVYFRSNNVEAWTSFDISGISGSKFIFYVGRTTDDEVILNTGNLTFDGALQSGFVPWG